MTSAGQLSVSLRGTTLEPTTHYKFKKSNNFQKWTQGGLGAIKASEVKDTSQFLFSQVVEQLAKLPRLQATSFSTIEQDEDFDIYLVW